MRILQINNCHYRRGGADIVYLNTGLLLEQYGHKVAYFSQSDGNNLPSPDSGHFVEKNDYFNRSLIKKIITSPRFFYSFDARRKLSALINQFSPDVAHIHLYKGGLTPSILKELRKKKIPVLISLHDYGMLCPHNLMLDGKMEICHRCVHGSPINCMIHRCNRGNFILSCVSCLEYIFHNTFIPFNDYFTRIIAVSKFGQNIHNDSGVVHNVDHLYNFFPNLQETKPNHEKGKYLLFFGRLSGEKGVNTLISAWMREQISSKLKIVGTGKLFDSLNEQVSTIPTIELLGYKKGKELIDLIRAASFIVVPSECYENNPLTIIEAYAHGKPVIGANVGGIPEIIDDGNTGFLFEMKSVASLSEKIGIAEAMDEYEYARFSDNVRKFAENHFDSERHYEKLIEIYRQTLSEKSYE